MRSTLKTAAALSIAALVLVSASLEANARPWRYGVGGWGPGLAIGFVAATIGAAAYANAESCIRYRPVYDAYGRYAGRQAVNVCP
jgi:hypothetical protein